MNWYILILINLHTKVIMILFGDIWVNPILQRYLGHDRIISLFVVC